MWDALRRWRLLLLGAAATFYALAILWYVPTHPLPNIGALLINDPPGIGVRMVQVDALRKVCRGNVPDEGDLLIELAGRPIRSYGDFASIVSSLRAIKLPAGAIRFTSNEISEEIPPDSSLSLIEYVDGKRWVRLWFLRDGQGAPLDTWVPLTTVSSPGVSLSLMTFILQGLVLLVASCAHWSRPGDTAVKVFVALCSLGLAAFVAGNHWWVLAGNPWLLTPFAASSVFLPAVLLHFAIVCPSPLPIHRNHREALLTAIYGPVVLVASLICIHIPLIAALCAPRGEGPFARTIQRLLSDAAGRLLIPLRWLILLSLGLAVIYFLLTLAALGWAALNPRNALEKSQNRPLLWAACFAVIPVGYTCYLAVYDHARFALGGSRLPMFLACLAFTVAYGVGIARYKLMLIDQIVSRGVWYYVYSNGLTLLICAVIAVGCVNGLQGDLTLFGQTVPITAALLLSVLVLVSFRDVLQRALDRRFFREKYQLDRALQRMNRVMTSVLEPEEIAHSLLTSCLEVLRVEHASLYLRRGERPHFRLASAVGTHDSPLQLQLEDEVSQLLSQDLLLQRIPGGSSAAQGLIRRAGAEVMYGLEQQGRLAGIVALGAKPNGSGYTAEDMAFVTALGRIAAVALHCVRVQEDVSRLNEDLRLKIDKLAEQSRQINSLQQELTAMTRTTPSPADNAEFHREVLKGDSEAIRLVLETARKVAPSHSSVLLRGESGTGKELLARILHLNSPRAEGPWVVAHCAAMSPSLLESELFGHVKGAFTDAREDRPGRFALAHGGTLFLDEIGDISLEVQVKLLRVIQERAFEPVGSNRTQPADVRIIAATHRPLEQLIAQGKFREDLYYRLNVISITMPALRDRLDDMYELTLHFLRLSSEKSNKAVLKIDEDAFAALTRHDWPGNVRELQNVIERAVVLTETDSVRLQDLPVELRSRSTRGSRLPEMVTIQPATPLPLPRQLALRRLTVEPETHSAEAERALLIEALEQHQGNKTEAARALKMPRSTLFSKLKKYGLA